MINNKRVVFVLPAYNAAKTLRKTYLDIPKDIVDEIILVDDFNRYETVAVAKELGINAYMHSQNLGYGANQKTCYKKALDAGTDIVIMRHPDYQYNPELVNPMAAMIASGAFDTALGSRILGGIAIKGTKYSS